MCALNIACSDKNGTLLSPPRHTPMFSRFTPYLDETSLPGPVYGQPMRRYRGFAPPPSATVEKVYSVESRRGTSGSSERRSSTEENRSFYPRDAGPRVPHGTTVDGSVEKPVGPGRERLFPPPEPSSGTALPQPSRPTNESTPGSPLSSLAPVYVDLGKWAASRSPFSRRLDSAQQVWPGNGTYSPPPQGIGENHLHLTTRAPSAFHSVPTNGSQPPASPPRTYPKFSPGLNSPRKQEENIHTDGPSHTFNRTVPTLSHNSSNHPPNRQGSRPYSPLQGPFPGRGQGGGTPPRPSHSHLSRESRGDVSTEGRRYPNARPRHSHEGSRSSEGSEERTRAPYRDRFDGRDRRWSGEDTSRQGSQLGRPRRPPTSGERDRGRDHHEEDNHKEHGHPRFQPPAGFPNFGQLFPQFPFTPSFPPIDRHRPPDSHEHFRHSREAIN